MSGPLATVLGRRSVLNALTWFTAGATTGVGVILVPQLATASQASPPPKVPEPLLKIATVLAAPAPTAATVTVKLDGDGPQLTLPYTAPYVPVAGDVVYVHVEGSGPKATGVVLGGKSAAAGNLVLNGDFTRIPQLQAKAAPHNWYHHRAAGSKTLLAALFSPRYQRPMMCLSSFPELAGDNTAYSAAIEVAPGDTLKVDASMVLDVVGTMKVSLFLRVAWFADLAAGYPKQIAESTVDAEDHPAQGEYLFSGTAKAPAGAVAARVAIRAWHRGDADSGYTLYVGHVQATR